MFTKGRVEVAFVGGAPGTTPPVPVIARGRGHANKQIPLEKDSTPIAATPTVSKQPEEPSLAVPFWKYSPRVPDANTPCGRRMMNVPEGPKYEKLTRAMVDETKPSHARSGNVPFSAGSMEYSSPQQRNLDSANSAPLAAGMDKPQGWRAAQLEKRGTCFACRRCFESFPTEEKRDLHMIVNARTDCPKYIEKDKDLKNVYYSMKQSRGPSTDPTPNYEDNIDELDPETPVGHIQRLRRTLPSFGDLGHPSFEDIVEYERRHDEYMLPENAAARKRGEKPVYSWSAEKTAHDRRIKALGKAAAAELNQDWKDYCQAKKKKTAKPNTAIVDNATAPTTPLRPTLTTLAEQFPSLSVRSESEEDAKNQDSGEDQTFLNDLESASGEDKYECIPQPKFLPPVPRQPQPSTTDALSSTTIISNRGRGRGRAPPSVSVTHLMSLSKSN